MMVVDCPDALVTLINAGIVAEDIDSGVTIATRAVRSWVPRKDAGSISATAITVVPEFREKTIVSRADDECLLQPSVYVARSVNPAVNAEVDAVARLMQEIEDYVERTTLVGSYHQYKWIGQEPVELSDETLINDRVFWAGLRVTYKVFD